MRATLASVLLLAGAAGGCVDELTPLSGTTSLRVTVLDPVDPGTEAMRLPDTARDVRVTVSAVDADGNDDVGFSKDVSVYVQFLGGLTPGLDDAPLTTIAINGGFSAEQVISLPPVFGPTFLWIEDGADPEPSYATGTSSTLWYRDPYLVDVSQPPDEGSLDALSHSPLMGKQLSVTGSRYGSRGRLIVTGVYTQAYTVSDSECADDAGTPPCVTGAYDHVMVFTFNRPRDEDGETIELGQVVTRLTGAAQEFNGLTEIAFPQTFTSPEPSDPARVPAPATVAASWLADPIQFERVEGGLVEIVDATLCPLDEEWDTYKQWKLDIGAGCADPINVITSGIVEFAPADYVGQVMPRVIGTLRPVNIGSFNVWIIYPRFFGDLTLP